jgi:hypothetical protein
VSDDIERQKLQAFQHALGQNLVGIVGRGDDGKFGTQIGTGTLIETYGRRFILTAAHVVEKCKLDELRFLLPAPGGKIVEPGERVIMDLSHIILREPLALDSMNKDDALDVAILRFADDAVLQPFWSFRQVRRLPIPIPQPSQYIILGFPVERAIKFVGPDRMVIPNIDYLEVIDSGARTLQGFDPEIHFLTDFPSSD